MSTLRLEIGEFATGAPCRCCGARSRTSHGFVYKDDDAYAVYYAGWSEGHLARGVTLAISVGEWSEGSTPADRVTIGMLATSRSSSIDFVIVNPTESPWGSTPLLGDMLGREQALAHPVLKDGLHVAEHVVRDDMRVRRFLSLSEGSSA